ncbi:hypothetical protein ACH5RR_024522 [Cinchona calisaya]|uniref:Transcription repressor n=1 Tax=Cinchona calisaya TaxID=153742 RepID=A0ABD2YWX4_9GENT
MPNQLQKSLQDYLSKMKKPPNPQIQSPSSSGTLSSSTSWILGGCKHPKTPSFAFYHKKESDQTIQDTSYGAPAATLSDVDRFLLKNFKSLYKKEEEDEEDSIVKSLEAKNEENLMGHLFESPRLMDPPDINLCGSHRFFVAPASSSGSIINEARLSSTTSKEASSTSTTTTTTTTSVSNGNKVLSSEDFITILKYSWSPYEDFKKSMHEMIDSRLHQNGKIDWEFMEDLLFCYLNLNEKKSHGFILRAFVDVIVFLRENSGSVVPAKPRSVRSNNGRRRGGQNNYNN